MSEEFRPVNQEKDDQYNREPGIALVAGSNLIKEVSKYEQFPSIYTIGTTPGNPYTYRPYPKMLYRAEHYKGKAVCMANAPDISEFRDDREYERAVESANRFTERCQKVVGDDRERSRAMEDGWRESPDEAVAYLLGRDKDRSTATAHRLYEDRNMSDLAKREIAQAQAQSDGQFMPEVPEQPRRRGRPRKNPQA